MHNSEEQGIEIKNEVEAIKVVLNDIKKNCCNMKLIEKSIEARILTNVKLETISNKISSLEKADREAVGKMDTLYKALYIGMGVLAMFQVFFLPKLSDMVKIGG